MAETGSTLPKDTVPYFQSFKRELIHEMRKAREAKVKGNTARRTALIALLAQANTELNTY